MGLDMASQQTESEVLAALESWKKATLDKDAAALDKLLHPDLAYSHSDCRTETKGDVLEKTPRSGAQAIEFSEIQVRVYGDAAIVKANVDYTNRKGDQTSMTPLNVLHVFVKRPEGWQMAARQATRRPE